MIRRKSGFTKADVVAIGAQDVGITSPQDLLALESWMSDLPLDDVLTVRRRMEHVWNGNGPVALQQVSAAKPFEAN